MAVRRGEAVTEQAGNPYGQGTQGAGGQAEGQAQNSQPTWQQLMRNKETTEQRYLRQTRNATVFIAVVTAIVIVLGIVGVAVTSTQLSHLNCQVSNSC
jgi:hypothetical protein